MLKISKTSIISINSMNSEYVKKKRYATINDLPSIFLYKTRFNRQLNCWSLRCSWSIACRRCSNYIFMLYLTPGFNILRKDNCNPRQETFKFLDLVHLILEILP